jgi:hypothetical protein
MSASNRTTPVPCASVTTGTTGARLAAIPPKKSAAP